MKTRHIFIALLAMAALPIAAQETYENARLMETDLNGTARYVGMGGALEALGADISTIRSNPAGLGLFRRSTANVSFGVVSQQDAETLSSLDSKKTRMSFDQAGFIYSMRSGSNSFVNFAINYTKSQDFSQILSAAGTLSGASQNKQSYIKGLRGSVSNGGFYPATNTSGEYVGWESETSGYAARTYNQVDYLYYNALLSDENGNFGYNDADEYMFNRPSHGYIGTYDFNVSANFNDRVYIGFTFGYHDVHYKATTLYAENIIGAQGDATVALVDQRRITGDGIDIKGGIIFRPIENSPFRIGAYVSTPTFYDLTTSNTLAYASGNESGEVIYGQYGTGNIGESYDFKLFTPWKFGLSVGHTVGNYLALGATYEYADYGTLDSRINDEDDYYDYYYDGVYSSSSSDKIMNRHTKRTLKGVSTLKLGVEYKPIPELALRAGYNFISSMYEKNGYKDSGLDSEGSYYSSTTDFTNWKQTNRITLGLGYSLTKKFTIDLAYQYSATDGDFYPFTSQSYEGESNIVSATNVSNKRHKAILTLGYKF